MDKSVLTAFYSSKKIIAFWSRRANVEPLAVKLRKIILLINCQSAYLTVLKWSCLKEDKNNRRIFCLIPFCDSSVKPLTFKTINFPRKDKIIPKLFCVLHSPIFFQWVRSNCLCPHRRAYIWTEIFIILFALREYSHRKYSTSERFQCIIVFPLKGNLFHWIEHSIPFVSIDYRIWFYNAVPSYIVPIFFFFFWGKCDFQ